MLTLGGMLVYTSTCQLLWSNCCCSTPFPLRLCEILHLVDQLEWHLPCTFIADFCKLCLAGWSYGLAPTFLVIYSTGMMVNESHLIMIRTNDMTTISLFKTPNMCFPLYNILALCFNSLNDSGTIVSFKLEIMATLLWLTGLHFDYVKHTFSTIVFGLVTS